MGKKKLPTIIDVAKRANVSKSTVSKYLNGKGYVSEDASRKISEAIQELGYVPSIVAKSLATRRTYMIGTVINNIRNPFFSELAAAIEQEARKYGYDNLLISSHDDIEAWQTQIYAIQRRSLDGVINATSMALDERHAISVPVVYVNTTISGQFDLVILDNYMGGWMAAEYLIKRGHRHVACIHGPLAKSVFNERVHGFRACLAHYGWPAREELFIEVVRRR
jgi:LacI family transcriptional regulator